MKRGFSLVEVMVSLGLLSLIFGLAVLPLRRKSGLATANPQAVSALVASEFRAARNRAVSSGIPTGIVIPSQNGTRAHAQSLYVVQGFLPAPPPRDPALPPEPSARILRVLDFSREYPNVYLFCGTWDVDSAQLNNPALIPAIGESAGQPLEDWIKPTSKDFQFVFLPDGSVVTNDLCHFDSTYHLVVCSNLAYMASSAPPGTPSMTTPPAYAQLTAAHRPYTVKVTQQGAISLDTTVTAASAVSDCGPGVPLSSVAPPPVPPPASNTAPAVADVTVSPAPNPSTSGGFDAIVQPHGFLMLIMRIVDPEGDQVAVQWNSTPVVGSGSGTFTSPPGMQLVEYDTEQGCWVARFVWLPPVNAAHGDQYELSATITDVYGATTTISGGAAIDVEARITGNFFYRDGNWICSVDGDGTAVRQVISGGMEPEVSPDGSKLAYQNANGISICNSDGSNPELITGAGCNNPTWSPDGLYLAYQDDGAAAIKFMRLHDRTESTITIPNGNNPTWSRQGRLCYQSAGELFLADFTIDSLFVTPAAPTITPLTFTGAGASAGLAPSEPTWSADGATLAFTYRSDTIYTCDVSAPDPVERYHAPGRTVDRAWLMPGGPVTRVAFADRTPAGVGSIKLANIDLSGTAVVSGVIDLIPGAKLKGRTSWGP